MSLALGRSEYFFRDVESQYRWYVEKANAEIAIRYLLAVDLTVRDLANQPDLGRIRHFRHVELSGIRSLPVQRPFNRHLVFYRFDAQTVYLVRVMHGARNLPRRLREPPA